MPNQCTPTVTMREASQDFDCVAHIVDERGQVVILQNKKPKYLLVDIDQAPLWDITDDERIDVVAARVMQKYRAAFLSLANNTHE